MEADEEALRRDLAAPGFVIGTRREKWALKSVGFPHVLFFIAAPARAQGPAGFLLRSECKGLLGDRADVSAMAWRRRPAARRDAPAARGKRRADHVQ